MCLSVDWHTTYVVSGENKECLIRVVLRREGHRPIFQCALVWITFLGAPWVLLQDRHVRIEILVDALPGAAQRGLGITVSIIAIFACLVLTWKTGVAAVQYIESDIMMARIWRIPRIWPYSIIPIGSLLMAFAFVVRLHLYLTDNNPEREFTKRASAGQVTGLDDKELN